MNANQLMRMAMRLFMRKGMKHLAKKQGGGNSPELKRAKQAMKVTRRVGRM